MNVESLHVNDNQIMSTICVKFLLRSLLLL